MDKLVDHIRRYLEQVNRADSLFRSVHDTHRELITCKPGCNDCCSVYFELSFVEAFYISGMFHDGLDAGARSRALERAEKSQELFDRARSLLAAAAEKDSPNGSELEDAAARIKIPCPLNEDGVCVLYDHRPITCRLYGIPQRIGTRVVVCPKTGFQSGGSYVTVDMADITNRLQRYSVDLIEALLGERPRPDSHPLFEMPRAICAKFDKDFFIRLRDSLE